MLKVDINLVFTIINLLVLFVAMRIFFFKPIKKIIEDRQAEADRQFEEAKEKQEEVVVITISSKLSGTYNGAMLAKDMAEYDNIYVVDSLQASLSERLLVE